MKDTHFSLSLKRQYGIVIDAGSSGSRIQIYSWLHHELARSIYVSEGKPLNVMPRIEPGVQEGDEWQLKVMPGISTFASNPQDVGPYLEPLLDRALEVIPPDKLASTPIYLLATAGMRLLSSEQQQNILTEICHYLRRNYTFHLQDCSANIRVITGEEEGIFGWTAVNYLLDGFDSHAKSDRKLALSESHRGQHSSTFGFLDLGGASAQIAFEPSPEERLKHDNDLEHVELRLLDGRTLSHPVFVTTWLGYGTNQARDRYIQQISADVGSGQGTIPDPCLPKDLLLAADRNIMLKGTGDFSTCIQTLSPLLNKEAPCPDEPCLFAGVHAPAIDFAVNHFIGISEYWYSTNEIFQLGGIYDFVEFEKAAVKYCATDWDDIVASRRDGVDMSRLQMQCFKAAWLVNILHEGIGIPRLTDKGGKGDGQKLVHSALGNGGDKGFAQDEGSSSYRPAYFQSVDHVNNVAVSWTLGKMVLEVSTSIPEAQDDNLDRSGWFPHIDFGLSDLDQLRLRIGTLTRLEPPLIFSFLFFFLLIFFCFKRRSFSSWKYFSPARRRTSDIQDLEALEAGEPVSSPYIKRQQTSGIGVLGGTLRRWSRKLSMSLGRSSARSALPHHHQMSPMTTNNGHTPLNQPDVFSVRPQTLRYAASSPLLSVRKTQEDATQLNRRPSERDRDSLLSPQPPGSRTSSRSPSPNPAIGKDTREVIDLQETASGLERSVTPLSRFGRTSSVRPPSRNSSSTSLASGFYARRAKDAGNGGSTLRDDSF